MSSLVSHLRIASQTIPVKNKTFFIDVTVSLAATTKFMIVGGVELHCIHTFYHITRVSVYSAKFTRSDNRGISKANLTTVV